MRDKVTVQVNKIVRRNCQHLYACKHGVQEVFLCTQQSRSARASPVHQSRQWDALDLVPLNSHEVDVLGSVNSLVNGTRWTCQQQRQSQWIVLDRSVLMYCHEVDVLFFFNGRVLVTHWTLWKC